MIESVNEIKNYILFLKKQCKLDVTLHPMENEQIISNSRLMSFNIHENSYCVYVKSFSNAQRHCILRQGKIVDKCTADGSFCGTCYAGVREYVYPIICEESIVGFICISGYKDTNFLSYMERCSEKFEIPTESLINVSQCLKEKMPDKAYVDTLVIPLIRMLELAYSKMDKPETESDIVESVIGYVNRCYTQDITLKDICDEFHCSRSYISHIFKKTTGMSFREYLTDVRIRAAKSLLKHSVLKVTEIALSVGFNDSNYFSSVFRTYTGFSPRAYRYKNQTS